MIDIFAIADIRYEILSYLDHFTLMRACCCKDWLVTSQRILSTVTHAETTTFGYMAACPNLVSVKINGPMTDIFRKLYKVVLPKIRTVEYVDYGGQHSLSWTFLLEMFTNIENMVVNHGCINYTLHCNTIAQWLLGYPNIKKLTIQNVSIYINTISFDLFIPVTLIRCYIHTLNPLADVHNLTLLNCTII
jgi:hypothetical protein